jgi:multicomponent Na+:H+ antiporter subunit D
VSSQYPILIILFPLFSSFLIAVLGWFKPGVCYPIAVAAMFASLFCASQTLAQVYGSAANEIHYFLGNWKPPFGIEYVIDPLNAMVLVVVTLVAFLTAVYSGPSVKKELQGKVANFYTLFVLLVTGLLGITITGDAFNLYVLLEIAALTSYALIALGRGRAYFATFNYVILGTIGACFYLLGVGYLLIKTGSLNMQDMASILQGLHESKAVFLGFLFIMIGMWIKMALFPVHGWLPNAYFYAPTAAGCLVAPLMTKVSVYVMLRMMYSIFSADYVFSTLSIQPAVMGLAVLAILAGSLFAMAQTNIRKMLTYLIVAEIGYMVGGAWLGNALGLTGAIYHIGADALMTACLFMAVGCVAYSTGSTRLEDFRGAFYRAPWTMAAFTLGAASMVGIPPTCGFFSKWYLLGGAYQAGHWWFLSALLISSLINAFLFFRILEVAYFGALPDEDPDPHHAHEGQVTEAPVSMLFPLWVSAGLLVTMGLYTNEIVTGLIQSIIPKSFL